MCQRATRGGDICACVSLAEIEFRDWTEERDGGFHGRAADSDVKILLLVKMFNLLLNSALYHSLAQKHSVGSHCPVDKILIL